MEITPEEAWEIYRDLPEPTARECARILQERGVKVSYDTIARWVRLGKWREKVEQLRTIAGVGSPKDVAAALKVEAEMIDPEMLKGLQYRLVAKMAEQIDQVPLDKPEDYAKLVDVIDRMDATIHRHRGEEIGARKEGNGKSPITLEEFKVFRRGDKPPGGEHDA